MVLFLWSKVPLPQAEKPNRKCRGSCCNCMWLWRGNLRAPRPILEIILPEVTPYEIQSTCAQQGAIDFTPNFIIK